MDVHRCAVGRRLINRFLHGGGDQVILAAGLERLPIEQTVNEVALRRIHAVAREAAPCSGA